VEDGSPSNREATMFETLFEYPGAQWRYREAPLAYANSNSSKTVRGRDRHRNNALAEAPGRDGVPAFAVAAPLCGVPS
jgi:hypothetical protein